MNKDCPTCLWRASKGLLPKWEDRHKGSKLPVPLETGLSPRLTRLGELASARQVMLSYVKMKIEENDLHAAIDGLMDLRELDTELRVLREMENGK